MYEDRDFNKYLLRVQTRTVQLLVVALWEPPPLLLFIALLIQIHSPLIQIPAVFLACSLFWVDKDVLEPVSIEQQ